MRTELKTAFRPSLESFEARIVATGGVAAAAATHPAPHHPAHVAPVVHAESKHAAHPAKHPAAHPAAAAPMPVATRPTPAPAPALPKDTTTAQAWVELVNMTGQDLEYRIKLGPYADGKFLNFDIGAGATQDRMSSLTVHGQRVKADFAIQFGNGPVTPLMTGISQHSAQGYYIFFDSNFQPYVTPFIRS